MSIKGSLKRRINSEHILLLFFLLLSIYMYIESYSFTGSYIFPRYSALIMIVLSFLIIFNDYLPESIQRATSSSGGLESYATEDIDKTSDAADSSNNIDESESSSSTESRNMKNAAVTVVMMIGYVGFSYLFGMLWITPLFVIAYTYWFDQPLKNIVIATLIATGFAYVFAETLFLPLDEGLLWEGW